MFKICLKNYVSNLKYLFAAMGIMFIMVVIGVQVTVNKSTATLDSMSVSIKETTDNTDLSITTLVNDLKTTVKTTVENLTIKNIIEGETLTIVKTAVQKVIIDAVLRFVNYVDLIVAYVQEAVIGVVMAIIVGLALMIGGIFLSGWLVTVFARYDISKDNIGRILYEQFIRGLFILAWIVITIGVFYLKKEIGIVLAVLYPLAYCFLALLSSWITAAKDRKPVYAEYVTFKNMIILLGCNVIQLLISAAIGVIIYFIGGIVIAALFGLALAVLATSNANLNAYSMLFNAQEKLSADCAVQENTEESVTQNEV